MMDGVYFSNPQLLWEFPSSWLQGLSTPLSGPRTGFMAASRLAVFCLILAAAANPYIVATHVVQSSEPSITILADKTASMSVFDPDVATRLGGVLPNSQIRTFSGESTPLGDKILQYAAPGSTLVLVKTGIAIKAVPWMIPWPWPGPPTPRCSPSRWLRWSSMPALRYRELILP